MRVYQNAMQVELIQQAIGLRKSLQMPSPSFWIHAGMGTIGECDECCKK